MDAQHTYETKTHKITNKIVKGVMYEVKINKVTGNDESVMSPRALTDHEIYVFLEEFRKLQEKEDGKS